MKYPTRNQLLELGANLPAGRNAHLERFQSAFEQKRASVLDVDCPRIRCAGKTGKVCNGVGMKQHNRSLV